MNKKFHILFSARSVDFSESTLGAEFFLRKSEWYDTIPVFFFSEIIAALILLCAGILYYTGSKKVGNRIREKRQRIEYELPRLVATIVVVTLISMMMLLWGTIMVNGTFKLSVDFSHMQ